MQFIRDILDLLNWYDSVPAKDKKPKANESTMENGQINELPEKIKITLSIKEVLRVNQRTFVNGISSGPTVQIKWKDTSVFKADSLKTINENRAFITKYRDSVKGSN